MEQYGPVQDDPEFLHTIRDWQPQVQALRNNPLIPFDSFDPISYRVDVGNGARYKIKVRVSDEETGYIHATITVHADGFVVCNQLNENMRLADPLV